MAEGHIEVGEERGKKLRTIIRKIDGVEKHEEVVQVSEGHIVVDKGTIKITDGNVRVDGSTIIVSGGNITVDGKVDVSGSTIILSDGTSIAEVDLMTKALAVIEIEHHKVHDGRFFIFTYQGTWDTDSHYCVMKTPATQDIHCKIAVIASNPCEFNFFEDSTTNAGTTVPVYNANRQSPNVSGVIFAVEPTISVVGTKIDTSFVGTQNPRILIGGDTRPQAEWILKKDTEYTLQWQAEQAGTRVVLLIEFYEVFPS